MQIHRLCLAALSAFAVGQPVVAQTRDLHAHEHGHVTLQVAVDGESVEMILEAPGADIVGFEHSAETDEQKAAVQEAMADLADPMALFILPEAAGCTGEAAEVELHQEGDHNAFEVEYSLTCTDPAALTEIETRFFELYPSVEEIEVEYATPAGQGAGELEPGEALPLPTS